jgi:3-oxoacyl-[acyl-carrier-protein] synthase II
MRARRQRCPAILDVSAVCSGGATWEATWEALLKGEALKFPYSTLSPSLQHDVPVSGLSRLDRSLSPGPKGAACRLALAALQNIPVKDRANTRFYGGSNHGESDLVVAMNAFGSEDGSLWRGLLLDPLPNQFFHENPTWIYSACTSGMHALVAALMDLEESEIEHALVVGVDAFSLLGVAGFQRMHATAEKAAHPFQDDRDGLLIGEGAACLRLKAVGSGPLKGVRVLGYGLSCDAGHPTDPNPDGIWIEQAIRQAIDRAHLSLRDISAIIAHGTGTYKNDAAEAKVYQRLWPEGAIPVTSLKGTIGHTMGASGLFNVLAAFEATRVGLLPPSAGEQAAVLPGIDLVRGSPRSIQVSGSILAVASGFGGNNVAVIVGAD